MHAIASLKRHLTSAAVFGFALLVAAFFAVTPALASAHAEPPPENEPGAVGTPVGSEEQVSAFTANIVVNADGTIVVTEHIDYFFPESRHGIYRDIPTRYEFEDGREVDVPVEVLSVQGNNNVPVPYEVDRNRVGLRIKIGDPDRMVSGSQSYDIVYRASGALRYFDDHDEIYWNVTGNDWKVPLRRVAANVTYPSGAKPSEVTTACYTGPAGSKESDCVKGVMGTAAQFASNGPMTVVVGWPPRLVAKLEALPVTKLSAAAEKAPLLLPVGVFGLMFWLWHKHGRDPKGRGTHMVEYDPPDQLTPAETGTLLDGDAGNSDISAIIVDLAVRGYLHISEVETKVLLFTQKDYEFRLLKDQFESDKTLKPFEQRMLRALFPDGSKTVRVSDIKRGQTFYKSRDEMVQDVYDGLVQQGYFPKNPFKVKVKYFVIALAVFLFGLVAGGVLKETFGEGVARFGFVGVTLSAVIIAAFAPFMPRVNEKGALAKEKVAGFKDYLQTAEKYRLQWQEKEGIFEKFLPYAMVYGVAEKWAGAFAGMHLAPPSWYSGTSTSGAFNPVLFAGSMKNLNSMAGTAMNSRPSSSSSGSGFSGSSGGGFGGGGGGSW